MTTIDAPTRRGSGTFPTPVRPDDDRFVGLAADIGAVAADHAADHDRDATFVTEAYEAMAGSGYLEATLTYAGKVALGDPGTTE